jgi:tRNA threonylcarbamoyladenosine biosynthesis protein TsaE
MNPIQFLARSLDDTERLGAALAECLPDGTTVCLSGTLGAGKTRLVQAVAAHCGVPREEVVSPTFVLCQEYHGSRPIYHLDAYRLAGDEEFERLGVAEYFQSRAMVFVEWGDRVRRSLPAERLEIDIELDETDARLFRITACGDRLSRVMQDLQARLEGS